MAKKVKIGDIIEIHTRAGLRYAQFSHYHSLKPNNWGVLLRILPGVFAHRPEDFKEVASTKELYFTFFPLQAAINRRIVEVVGHEKVPDQAQKFPLFRNGVPNPATGKVEVWWLWDGVKEWKVGKLTGEQLDLPLLSIPSYPTLVEWIETGWTPRRADEFVDRAREKIEHCETDSNAPTTVTEIRHYLVFKDRSDAEKAAAKIRSLNLQTAVTDLGESWGINVLQSDLAEIAIEKLAQCLENIASVTGGIYDGNQVKVSDISS
jgi:hypothetical protein